MAKTKLVTIPDFAKLLGVSHQRLYAAAKKGKFETKKIKGHKWVDPEKAKAQWEISKDKTAAKKNPSGLKGSKKPLFHAPPKVDSDGDMTHSEAERVEKVFRAKLAEMKYQEQAKELVSKSEVDKSAFDTARKTRNAILSIPARVAHELAAETDPHKLENRLTKELIKSLEHLTGGKS